MIRYIVVAVIIIGLAFRFYPEETKKALGLIEKTATSSGMTLPTP